MKQIIILVFVIMLTGYSNASAQLAPSGDGNLRDTNVKGRSNELERVKRDSDKPKKNKINKPAQNQAPPQPEDKLAAKYEEIKTDYERIQLSQDFVIKAYQSCDKIDYEQIEKSALEINLSAARLNSNMFPPAPIENTEKKEEKDSQKEIKTKKSVRDLIVELDNAIGSFALSPMFQNLRAIDPQVFEKAKLDLDKIIELSGLLESEARKMNVKVK